MDFFRQKGNARTRRKLEHGFRGEGNHCLFYSKEHYGSLQDKPAFVTENERIYKAQMATIGPFTTKHVFSHKGFRKRLVSSSRVSPMDNPLTSLFG